MTEAALGRLNDFTLSPAPGWIGYRGRDDRTCPMQQSLDRRQPVARSRPQSREIPLQRRHGPVGNSENNRQWTFRDDRSGPVASGVTAPRERPPRTRRERRAGEPLRRGGVLVRVGNAPDTTRQDVHTGIAATTRSEEHVPDLVDLVAHVPPDAVLGGDVRQALGGPAALPAGTDVGQQAAVVLAADDLLRGDLPMVSDQAWEWMEPLLPSSTGRRGGRWRDHRQVVEAICWKYRTGSPWRELPARFGPWQTEPPRVQWRLGSAVSRVSRAAI
jgi:Putative transposase of IS4/5 family (DUF4096)